MRTFFLLAITTLVLQSSRIHAAAPVVFANPSATPALTPPSVGDEDNNPSYERQYTFEGKLVKIDNALFKKKSIVRLPRIIFTENRTAKIVSLQTTPFVTSVEILKGPLDVASQPIITALDEGHTVEVKVTAVDDEYVQLDARISFLKIDSVETDTVGGSTTHGGSTTQAPIHDNITRRVVRTVKLGETLQLNIPAFGKEKPVIFEYKITEIVASGQNCFKVDSSSTSTKARP